MEGRSEDAGRGNVERSETFDRRGQVLERSRCIAGERMGAFLLNDCSGTRDL